MAYRILHIADVHLERPFAAMGCQGELARSRRLGLREVLRRAGEAASERRCQAVTIGGDLFEDERAGVDTARFLASTFSSWQPMRVFIAPGNHDPLLPHSIYARTDWPSNVHIFSEPVLTPVRLDEGLTLWGLAHLEPAWQGDPLDCPDIGAEAAVHLALFHGAELGSRPDGKSIHGPFHMEDIRARGFAAALCGHYHRQRLDTAGGLIYPGSPEPLTFDESGARGAVLVSVEPSGRVGFEALTLNRWSAVSISCSLEGVQTMTSAIDRACAAALAATAGMAPQRTIVRIDLEGEVTCDVAVDLYTLERAVRDATDLAVVRARDFTHPDLDGEKIAEEPSARGEFARQILAALAEEGETGERRSLLNEALRYGLQAMSGVEVGLR
ncbi:MAG TPA: metallophosphoesterase [Candidatus Sulfotelmatobacter sp.]|nr:metallophosphoesterase [Candidatus Sulfotelmatobacter sp.]